MTLTMDAVKFMVHNQNFAKRLLSSSWPPKLNLRIRMISSFGKDRSSSGLSDKQGEVRKGSDLPNVTTGVGNNEVCGQIP